MEMLKKNIDKNEIIFILNNLRDEDECELLALWGEDWRNKALSSFEGEEVLILYGKDNYCNFVPIAMGGFCELFEKDSKIACVWMLTTKFIKYNKLLLSKNLKQQINNASEKYDIMYNYIYKSKKKKKNWLRKMGFKFDNPRPEKLKIAKDFEFFYKLNKRKEYY